jgi:hypothetical protein
VAIAELIRLSAIGLLAELISVKYVMEFSPGIDRRKESKPFATSAQIALAFFFDKFFFGCARCVEPSAPSSESR